MHIEHALDALEQGQDAIIVMTRGLYLKMNSDGSGTSGNWPTKPAKHGPPEKLIIYRRPDDHAQAEVYVADYVSDEPASEPKRVVIHFRGARLVGTTTRNWHEFASTGTFPVRYLSKV